MPSAEAIAYAREKVAEYMHWRAARGGAAPRSAPPRPELADRIMVALPADGTALAQTQLRALIGGSKFGVRKALQGLAAAGRIEVLDAGAHMPTRAGVSRYTYRRADEERTEN